MPRTFGCGASILRSLLARLTLPQHPRRHRGGGIRPSQLHRRTGHLRPLRRIHQSAPAHHAAGRRLARIPGDPRSSVLPRRRPAPVHSHAGADRDGRDTAAGSTAAPPLSARPAVDAPARDTTMSAAAIAQPHLVRKPQYRGRDAGSVVRRLGLLLVRRSRQVQELPNPGDSARTPATHAVQPRFTVRAPCDARGYQQYRPLRRQSKMRAPRRLLDRREFRPNWTPQRPTTAHRT